MYHFTMDLELYDPIKKDNTSFDQYIEDTAKIVDDLFHKLNQKKIKITCFVTNEFVEIFPDVFEKKISRYHEISCHTATHNFFNGKNKQQFFKSIQINKSYLEKITGKNCYGFRSPGGLAPKDLISYLIKLGFKYDSSVVPGFLPGRQYNLFSPRYPYYPDKHNIYKKGDNQKNIIEFPLSVFPIFRISTNGFFYPYLFVPFKRYYFNKTTTTYVHLRNFYDISGKNFIWDYLKFKKNSMSFFHEFLDVYKNRDTSIINHLDGEGKCFIDRIIKR